MKQFKVIEVSPFAGRTCADADFETWGVDTFVQRLNDLSDDGWYILQIVPHCGLHEETHIYLQKGISSLEFNNWKKKKGLD